MKIYLYMQNMIPISVSSFRHFSYVWPSFFGFTDFWKIPPSFPYIHFLKSYAYLKPPSKNQSFTSIPHFYKNPPTISNILGTEIFWIDLENIISYEMQGLASFSRLRIGNGYHVNCILYNRLIKYVSDVMMWQLTSSQ